MTPHTLSRVEAPAAPSTEFILSTVEGLRVTPDVMRHFKRETALKQKIRPYPGADTLKYRKLP